MPSSDLSPSSRNDASSRRRFLGTSAVALSASLAGCVGGALDAPGEENDGSSAVDCSQTDQPFPDAWPLYGYDSRNTGANPNAVGPKAEVETAWSAGGRGSLRGTPIVADGTVFVQERPTSLTAYARDDGAERWSVRLGATDESKATNSHSGPHLTPAVVGETVYVGGGNVKVEQDGMASERVANHFRFAALDRRTGEVRWSVRPDEFPATAPVVAGDAVLFATVDGTVYAVERESGTVAWTLAVDSMDAPLATPAVDECDLYLNTVEGGLFAIDAGRGELRWRSPAVESVAAPAVGNGQNGLVYVGGIDGTVYAIDPAAQAVAWEYDAGRAISTASPAVSSETVFVGSADGEAGDEEARVHALDAETGEEIWSAETTEYVNSSPAVADGVAYVAARDTIFGFDAETGDERWTYDVNAAIRAPLSVADGTVYAGKLNGQLHALTERQT